jgi:hypothetical protein
MTFPSWLPTPLRWAWALVGKISPGRQARERQLREPMMADARDFSTGVHQAIMAVKDAVERPARRLSDVSVAWKAQPEVDRLVDEANARLARVHVDFGPSSEAGTAAEWAIAELRAASSVLGPGKTDLVSAAESANRAEAHLREFNESAGRAIGK